MALATIQRPVRPRKEEDEEYFETTGVTSEEDDASSASGQEDQDALEDFDDESNSYPELETQDRDVRLLFLYILLNVSLTCWIERRYLRR
jgi:hypothetical protein